MPSFPKEVALAEEPAARQSVVGFLRNVNRKSTAVTQGARAGVGDRDALLMEKLLAFKRAGCSGVLTYHAPRAAQLLNG